MIPSANYSNGGIKTIASLSAWMLMTTCIPRAKKDSYSSGQAGEHEELRIQFPQGRSWGASVVQAALPGQGVKDVDIQKIETATRTTLCEVLVYVERRI